MSERVVVVAPTFCERSYLGLFVGSIRSAFPDADVLLVDDASPDGTGALADQLARVDRHINVLHRTSKRSLGASYLEGFAWARDRSYDVIVQMDADGSHKAAHLPALLAALEGADVVLTRRWSSRLPDDDVLLRRRERQSRLGNACARWLLGLPFRDVTGTFRVWRAPALAVVLEQGVTTRRFCQQVDLAAAASQAGLRIAEVPVEARERQKGRGSDRCAAMAVAVCWAVAAAIRRLPAASRRAT